MEIGNALKNYKRLLALFASIVIFLGAFTIVQYQAIKDREDSREKVAEVFKNIEWDYIWSAVDLLKRSALDKANTLAKDIKEDIIDTYKHNGRSLLKDVKNLDQDNHPIINIFADHLIGSYLHDVQSDANDPFIATRNGIASDFSVDCSSDGRTRSFEKEISLHYNKDLAKKAIDKILMVSTNGELIGWQFSTPKNIGYTIHDFSEQNLKDVYFTYGLLGLESYEFLSVAYIEQKTDLLGGYVVDSRGILQPDNNQFIVAQGFNIVQQIQASSELSSKLKVIQNEASSMLERANYEIGFMQFILVVVFAMMLLIFIIGSLLLNEEAIALIHSVEEERNHKE